MSERSRSLPRRSCLSVPGSSAKMLAKAPSIPADMVFFDLEDSVAPVEKEGARDQIIKAANELDWGDRVLCVRVNAWDTRWTYRDVIAIAENCSERLDEIMLPKVQSADEVKALDLLLTQIETTTGRRSRIGIEAQIETARGLINVEEICAASSRLETIIFGPVDFTASLEMTVRTGGTQVAEYPGDHLHYVLFKILVAGRANGLQVIDGPYPMIRDSEGLRDFATRTRTLGYDGKWALNPAQVTVCNEVYTPTQTQYDRAHAILDTYREATQEGRVGALMFGDEMIDEASAKVAVKQVARGERAGLERSGPAG
ncbi:MAG: HpcH/HpaI aldolase/citrate lyase family protein [Acidimicrobiia bacterium]